jgi:sterol desaturase/sphingolipid hydroxylase (fatty acid hydroxylase superfamily)
MHVMPRRLYRPKDPTLFALPLFFSCLGIEYLRLRRQSATREPTAGDYERRDTIASLTMGTASLVTPLVLPRLLHPFALGRGRYGKALAVGTLGVIAATTAADRVARRSGRPGPADRWPSTSDAAATSHDEPASTAGQEARRSNPVWARRLASAGGVAAVVMGGVVASATWAVATAPQQLWRRRFFGSRGTGPLALAGAVAGWDFLYYWNHRLAHERRYLWAIHVVHHSSERYNYATALRQPVVDELGPSLPYGSLCLLGIAPGTVAVGRAVNLFYQFWVHTETIGHLGRPEEILNAPSHHRVHHGSNPQYLDRNYGSILIVWDRLFGTFEPEDERVVYGLTKNLDTFDPSRIAFHEHAEILRGVARSTSWGERLSYVFRGPGWAYRHDAELSPESAAGLAEGERAG